MEKPDSSAPFFLLADCQKKNYRNVNVMISTWQKKGVSEMINGY